VESFLNEWIHPAQTSHTNTTHSEDDTNLDDTTWVTAWMDDTMAIEEQDVKNDIELHDIAVDILEAAKEDLKQHVRYLELSQVDDDDDDICSRDPVGQDGYSNRRRKPDHDMPPTDFSYSFDSKLMDMTDQWIEQVAQRQDSVTCVSTNGFHSILLLASGIYYATPNLPPTLEKIIETKRNIRIKYVSLATNHRFFVSFVDGECNWFGPKSLDAILKDANVSKSVVCLAFGKQNSAYFIVYEDGSWQYGGQGIPSGLIEKLKERQYLQDVSCVSLGPDGEWFLKAKNGRMWWGGVSREMDDAYNVAIKRKRKLKFACFGVDNSYLMTFN
jgi:hypothetical protein